MAFWRLRKQVAEQLKHLSMGRVTFYGIEDCGGTIDGSCFLGRVDLGEFRAVLERHTGYYNPFPAFPRWKELIPGRIRIKDFDEFRCIHSPIVVAVQCDAKW